MNNSISIKYIYFLIKTNYLKPIKNKNKPIDFFDKTTYSEIELLRYQNELMSTALENTHVEAKKLFKALQGKYTYADRHKLLTKIYKSTIGKTKLDKLKIVKKCYQNNKYVYVFCILRNKLQFTATQKSDKLN